MKAIIFFMLACGYILQTLEAVGDDRMQRASNYFDAKEYDRALDIYTDLLNSSLTAWQQAIVKYNRGNVYLAQGHPAQAIEQYMNIPVGPDSDPLLTRSIQTNLAIALFLQSKRFTPATLNQQETSLLNCQEAYAAALAAIQADCALIKAEGGETCYLPQDLIDLKSKVKIYMAKLYDGIKPFFIRDITPNDGVPYLAVSLRQLISMIEALNDNPRSSYVEFSLDKASGWLPLWEDLSKKLSPLSKELQAMYAQALKHFNLGLNSLRDEDLASTRNAWNASLRLLNDFISQTYSASPVQEQLRKLLAFYQFAYVQIPLQEMTLLTLLDEQKKILEGISAEYKQLLENAQNDLLAALQALKANTMLKGRFYLEEGRFKIIELLRLKRQAGQEDPQDVLQAIIEAQHHALTLNQLRHVIAQGQESDMLKRTEIAQQQVVALAHTFLSAVFAWQEMVFQGVIETASKSPCQMHPWDEVLPQFDQGLMAAQQAVDIGHPHASSFQEVALAKFQAAWNTMHQPLSSFKGTCEGQAPAKGEQKASKPQKETPQPSLQSLMRDIMKMDEQDRLSKPEPAVQMGGEKPW